MNIAIVIHSKTGNTLKVAKEIEAELKKREHSTTVFQLSEESKIAIPDISSFDAYLFGGSVEGFSLEKYIKKELQALPSLNNKKCALFITQFFPFSILGGLQALGKMKKLITKKNGNIIGTGIVQWAPIKKQKRVREAIKVKIAELF